MFEKVKFGLEEIEDDQWSLTIHKMTFIECQ